MRFQPVNAGWSRAPLSQLTEELGVTCRNDIVELLRTTADARANAREAYYAAAGADRQTSADADGRYRAACTALKRRQDIERVARAFGLEVTE